MNDSVFIDTNILVYSYSITEPDKQIIARKLISSKKAIISTQVLQELSNTLNRKFKLDWDKIDLALIECQKNFTISINTEQTVLTACSLAKKYKYSFYDSLILAAALQNNCNILYS